MTPPPAPPSLPPGPEARAKRLQRLLADRDLAGLLVVHRPNVRYLTGFTGEGWLLVRPTGRPRLITDPRYGLQAAEEAPSCAVDVVTDGYLLGVARRLRRLRTAPVAFEPDRLCYATHRALRREARNCRLRAVAGLVEALRKVKDEQEIRLIRGAVAVSDRVYEELAPTLQPGLRECDVDWQIQCLLREFGAELPSFEPIVASGPRSALPHARPTRRRFGRRDQVKLDFGAVRRGYCSDMTRMVFLGTPTRRQREVYRLCFEAQQAALQAAGPGVRAAEVDRAARDVFRAAGCADAFSHGLGHGVGLEIHEGPALSARSRGVLEPGMVITIEPGLYFEGWGGVRIEDLAVIRCHGIEVLTRASKVEL